MTIDGSGGPTALSLAPDPCGEGAPWRSAAPAADRPPLRVLLVAYAFPPANAIGAVRIGKFAKYLHAAGHDVRVIAAPCGDGCLALEIPVERVTYAEARPTGHPLDGLVGLMRRTRAGGAPAPTVPNQDAIPAKQRLRAAVTRHYRALRHIPDMRAGWIAAAAAAGQRMARDWRPDVIVGSAPPNSGLVAAARIARACKTPWVAELRDLWVDNPYYNEPGWRLGLDRLLERRVLGTAAGLVSVTPRWTEALQRRYRQPAACIFNGYVEEDLPTDPAGPAKNGVVSIVYTGSFYGGYRDPGPLLQAVGMLGAGRDRVALHFYGPSREEMALFATAREVADRVFIHEPVSYKDSLAVQSAADVLLLLQWTDEKDAGNIPAKFYEYLGARRPILLLGNVAGDLAAMIRQRRAGVVANDPTAITDQLRRWIAQKSAGIPPIPESAGRGMKRDEQYRRYEQFLAEIATGRRAPGPG